MAVVSTRPLRAIVIPRVDAGPATRRGAASRGDALAALLPSTVGQLPGADHGDAARGGRLVVADPRRTKTAQEADEHLAIRPATDAFFLFALLHVLAAEGLVAPGAVADHLAGYDEKKKEFYNVLIEAYEGFDCDIIYECSGLDSLLDEVLNEYYVLDSDK